MLFWAHRGALWRGVARFQIIAKLVGGLNLEKPRNFSPVKTAVR